MTTATYQPKKGVIQAVKIEDILHDDKPAKLIKLDSKYRGHFQLLLQSGHSKIFGTYTDIYLATRGRASNWHTGYQGDIMVSAILKRLGIKNNLR